MEQSSVKKYIAVAAAVGFFMFFFAGNIFFPLPRLLIFDLFGISVGHSQESIINTEQFNATDFGAGSIQPQQPTKRLNGLVSLVDVKKGNGNMAEMASAVSVGYIGTFTDKNGKQVEFDRNTNPQDSFSFIIGSGNVIPGFEAGIVGMRENGVRIIIIEPEAGYGDRQVGKIPPNTTLQFIVELYEVRQ